MCSTNNVCASTCAITDTCSGATVCGKTRAGPIPFWLCSGLSISQKIYPSIHSFTFLLSLDSLEVHDDWLLYGWALIVDWQRYHICLIRSSSHFPGRWSLTVPSPPISSPSSTAHLSRWPWFLFQWENLSHLRKFVQDPTWPCSIWSYAHCFLKLLTCLLWSTTLLPQINCPHPKLGPSLRH